MNYGDYEDSAVYPEPRNRGKAWTPVQDGQLRAKLKKGMPITRIAAEMGRTQLAIECRIEVIRQFDACDQLVVKTTSKEKVYVNYNHLITLLQKGYTTVRVSFHQCPNKGIGDSKYTYKAPESYGLKADDLVVVETDRGMAVARVTEVHEEPEIDVATPYEYKWIVSKVDRSQYDEQALRESEAIKMLRVNERKSAQAAALATLMESVPNREELLALLNGG